MEITFHGVRGSIPVPGPETPRYGGNTSCASLLTASGQRFILDAGTGIITLGRKLMAEEFGRGAGEATILLTHAHWDHIQGFPFFPPVFIPGNRFALYGPGQSRGLLEGILEGQMNPNFSPLHTIKNLGATIDLMAVEGDGTTAFPCGEATLRAHLNPHGTTTALAWRIEADGRSVVWAPDCGYTVADLPEAAIDFYRGVDLLIHDSTYSPEDWVDRRERGFSSINEAAAAATRAGARKLALTHFDPDYNDEMVDSLLERTRHLLDAQGGSAIELVAAREGMTLPV